MHTALELIDLHKDFGDTHAVDGLSLTLEPGAFLGLLGRNGAGKSTLLNMVSGLLSPTSGSIRVLGMNPERDPLAVKRRIGVMPESGGLIDHVTGPQYLQFVGRMYALDDDLIGRRAGELFEVLDLSPAEGALISDFSTGMRKKLSLAAALLHGPDLLLLDEPFEGVDPVASRTIKELLDNISAGGMTLVLTSHVLEIVEKLCPRIAIMDRGRLLGMGTVEELRARHGDAENLEALFIDLMGGHRAGELSWL